MLRKEVRVRAKSSEERSRKETMKAMNQIIVRLVLSCVCALGLTAVTSAQTLQFLQTKVTDEGAIQLRWQSRSNVIYQIEYATEISSNAGWDVLVSGFPSQGTNTIYLDTGKYWTEPTLKHPKDDAQRFYRVLAIETNTLIPPVVTVTNPTPNAVLSGEVPINALISTTNSITSVRFYVDGEEVELRGADDQGQSSWTINTTEWPNGPHVIFVVAETYAGTETTGQASTAQGGAGVSAMIPVTFDNYISKWYFSLPGFDSSLGETQRITAKFEAYSTWTLEIKDEFNSTVRNASGTGATMLFDWDGLDDNGADLPNGECQFILTATQTTPPSPLVAGGGFSGQSLSPMMQAALEGKTSFFIESPPMPPIVIKKDGKLNIIPWEDVYGPQPPTEVKIPDSFFEKLLPPMAILSESGPSGPAAATSPQSTQKPRRPQPKPHKGTPGKLGVVVQGHHPDTTNGIPGFNPPANLIGSITLEPEYFLPYGKIGRAVEIGLKFEKEMTKHKWTTAFFRTNDQVVASSLRKPSKGGTNLFNYCNIGLLIGHGIRGTSQDGRATATPSMQTYYPVYRTGVNAYDWVRMSEFDFGGGPGGLRWMGIYACNMLKRDNALDMYNKGVLPMNANLHIFLGAETAVHMYPEFARLWASYMNGGEDATKHTVIESWNLASRKIHTITGVVPAGHTVVMTCAYWPDCVNDKLLFYTDNSSNDPSEILFFRKEVFPNYQTIP